MSSLVDDGRTADDFEWAARLGDVAVLPNLPEEATASGIILPSTKEPPRVGRVLSVGPDVKDLVPGQTVAYAAFTGAEMEISYEGRKVVLVDQKNCKLVRRKRS